MAKAEHLTGGNAVPSPVRMRSMQTYVLHSLYAKDIGPSGLALYGALLESAWPPAFRCRVSRRRLADMIGRPDVRAVDRAAARLVDAGLLEKQPRISANGDRTANLWVLQPIWQRYPEAKEVDELRYGRGSAHSDPAGIGASGVTSDDDALAAGKAFEPKGGRLAPEPALPNTRNRARVAPQMAQEEDHREEDQMEVDHLVDRTERYCVAIDTPIGAFRKWIARHYIRDEKSILLSWRRFCQTYSSRGTKDNRGWTNAWLKWVSKYNAAVDPSRTLDNADQAIFKYAAIEKERRRKEAETWKQTVRDASPHLVAQLGPGNIPRLTYD